MGSWVVRRGRVLHPWNKSWWYEKSSPIETHLFDDRQRRNLTSTDSRRRERIPRETQQDPSSTQTSTRVVDDPKGTGSSSTREDSTTHGAEKDSTHS